MKLRLKLTASHIEALYKMLAVALSRCPLEDLKEQPHDYLTASVALEVYQKLQAKWEYCRVFRPKQNKTISISLTQAQALALDIIINPHSDANERVEDPLVPLVPGSYEWDVARIVCEFIYESFYQ